MIVVILATALLVFGLWKAEKILFPKKEKGHSFFKATRYTDQEIEAMDRQARIQAREKRQKRGYSPAKEILRYEILRREGVITDRDFDAAKDDIIYG